MQTDVSASYSYCERTARQAARNFYYAFRLLPRPKRLAMCALYSFCRVADDIADQEGATEDKRRSLQSWRDALHQAIEGCYAHPIHPALHDAITKFAIPLQHLGEILDGVAMDLDINQYNTFAELYPYCYRVASAVGLACIHIWGFSDERAKKHAEAAGIAFQLTNILRDLAEDAGRGRVYLPREDLERFHYTFDQLKHSVRNEQFTDLMRFEVERTREYYEKAWPLTDFLNRPGKAIFVTMMRTYQGLLNLVEKRQYDVFSKRIRLSRIHKIGLALQAIPIRWGWS